MLQRHWARPVGCRLILVFFCLWTLGLTAQVRSRIAGPIDERALIRLSGTVHPQVAASVDLGRVAAELPMERALLHLTPSAEQDAALEELLAAQQDPGAPEYHQWLTPEQFGERFGISDADLAAVTSWLESQGLRVTAVSPGRRTIEFGGAAGKVEQAFHTELHEFQVAGERRIGNATEISIPRALAAVVAGAISLNNFPRRPMHRRLLLPQTDLNGGSHALSPYDFAAIYDVSGLWNNNFDGTGQTIGIAGRTNLKLSDVASFRSQFGLSAKAPQVIVNGADPGIISSDEETEADLDVEWSGGVAKGATVAFVVSASTNTTDGVDLSSQYLVDNNIASVISVSFGACESSMGTAGNAFYNSLWQQAAAQGIAVFVSAGDSGSAACDAPSSAPATHGFAVSGLASTPYNVAVGGTEFSDATAATYWNSSNNAQEASAKGYIPEVAWNESSYTTAGASGNGLVGRIGRREHSVRHARLADRHGRPHHGSRSQHTPSLYAGRLVERGGARRLPGGAGGRPLPGGRHVRFVAFVRRDFGNDRSVFGRPQWQSQREILSAGGERTLGVPRCDRGDQCRAVRRWIAQLLDGQTGQQRRQAERLRGRRRLRSGHRLGLGRCLRTGAQLGIGHGCGRAGD